MFRTVDLLVCFFVRILLCAVLLLFGQMRVRGQLFLLSGQDSTNAPLSTHLVNLGWIPSPDSVLGYFLDWGLASGDCTERLDAGNVTSVTLGGLETNITYYFSVVAYDDSGQESPPSNEAEYSVPLDLPVTNTPPDPPITNAPRFQGGYLVTSLVSFNGTNGAYPLAGLVQGRDGNFYGTTAAKGANGFGTLFQVTPSGVLTTLVSFNFVNGANPSAWLGEGQDGNLYGTTTFGGVSGAGTVFKTTTNGTLSTLVSLDFLNGIWPSAGLVQSRNGNFYGTTAYGGVSGAGAAFPMTTSGTVGAWYSFSGGGDGANPSADLVLGSDGSFYGTTSFGGTNGYGAIFRLTTNGELATLCSFTGGNGGASPRASLIQGTDGSFYGTTVSGGTNGHGTVFMLTTNDSLATLVSFNGANGADPQAGLVQGVDSNFYGTTKGGGAYSNYGTVFQMPPDGSLATLVSFNGTNGANPQAALLQASDGSFYGTTAYGGAFNLGTIFRLSFVAAPVIQAMPQTGGALALTWNATAGQTYQVQYKTALNQTNWNNLGSPMSASNGTATVSDAIGPDPQRFYRVVWLPY